MDPREHLAGQAGLTRRHFFTSSASFANPAITFGRMFSNTFAGIAPLSVPSFVVAQIVGGVVAILTLKGLYPDVTPAQATEVAIQTFGAAGCTWDHPAAGLYRRARWIQSFDAAIPQLRAELAAQLLDQHDSIGGVHLT